MIISLRGTNGAGKSHLVRDVMKFYPVKKEAWLNGGMSVRRKPIGYELEWNDRKLFVPGHYEIANGGLDTIGNIDDAYRLIKVYCAQYDVLYEGKNLTDNHRRLIELRDQQQVPCVAVFITTSFEECVASVRARGHSIAESTIRRLYDRTLKDRDELNDAGIEIVMGSRSEALSHVKTLLRLP